MTAIETFILYQGLEMNFGAGRPYEGCRSLYPASGRLQSVPPRYYDVRITGGNMSFIINSDIQVIDGESGDVLLSDRMPRSRTRSMVTFHSLEEPRNN